MTLQVGVWDPPGGRFAQLPEDYITQTVAILAKRGAGKSNAAVVIKGMASLVHTIRTSGQDGPLPTTKQGPSPRVAPVEPSSSADGRSASAAGSAGTGSTPASTPHQQGPTTKNSPRPSEMRPAGGELHPTAMRMLRALASVYPLALTTSGMGK